MCRFVGWLQKAAPPSVPGSGHKTAEEAADSLPDEPDAEECPARFLQKHLRCLVDSKKSTTFFQKHA